VSGSNRRGKESRIAIEDNNNVVIGPVADWLCASHEDGRIEKQSAMQMMAAALPIEPTRTACAEVSKILAQPPLSSFVEI
jgi:hypothetical protein